MNTMQTIQDRVTDWLLEKEDPSVRYRFLTEYLLEEQTSPLALEAKKGILESQPVLRIFKKMHPDGYWLHNGHGAGIQYSCSASTHYILSFLAELGLTRDDNRIANAVERYLGLNEPDNPEKRNPPPWQIPPDYRNHQSCLYAMNLRTFKMLGYGEDPRIEERKRVLLEDRRFDGGYLCERPSFKKTTKSCIRGSLKALMAYACYPELWSNERCRELVGYFIRRRVVYKTKKPSELVRDEMFSLTFPFIHTCTLIESLYALSKMGYGNESALQPCWEELDRRMLSDGKLPIDKEQVKVFASGGNGRPNKWITFYAYMALKYKEESPRSQRKGRNRKSPALEEDGKAESHRRTTGQS
jgi:hypothetical protein